MNDNPLVSIVTPSFNQGKFLRSTMDAVLGQQQVDMEYIVIDGGSTDDSVAIIKEFTNHPRLKYWCSEKDAGHYDALNKGFAQSSGEIMGWLNSDDLYLPHTLSTISNIFKKYPQVEWLTTTQHIHFNSSGEIILCRYVGGFSQKAFWRGNNLTGQQWFGRAVIQQESTFWRRSLWDRTGGYIDTRYDLAGDFELWCRFFKDAHLYAVDVPLAGIRKHKGQKTATSRNQYYSEAKKAFFKWGGKPYGRIESTIRRNLWYLVGYRSLRMVPQILSKALVKAGLFYPVKVIGWKNDQWQILTDYVV